MKHSFTSLPLNLAPVAVSALLFPGACSGPPDSNHASLMQKAESHNKAIYVLDVWMRDPFITRGPDDAHYLTGTTANPGDPRWPEDRYNSGLDRQDLTGSPVPAIVGTTVRVWRSENLVDWGELPAPFSLKAGYWATAEPEAFASVPERDWRLWAPEVHHFNGRWMILHTSPASVRQGANLAIPAGPGFAGPFSHLGTAWSTDTMRHGTYNLYYATADTLTGPYGDPVAVTPNLDRLASKGLRFDLAYCNQAVCMAPRYNLMLGSRSTSTGLYNFGREFRDAYPDAVTLPQHFMNAGYHAESMGKVYHIGHGNTNDEASWSIPHRKEKVIEYILPESTDRQLTLDTVLAAKALMGWHPHSYALMRNHFHLAVENPEPNLVEGMHWLQSTGATRFNRFRQERGHSLQGRCQAVLIEDAAA